MNDLAQTIDFIESCFEKKDWQDSPQRQKKLSETLEDVFALLEDGRVRVAQKQACQWQVHHWVKKAILLYFQTHESALISHSPNNYFDKIPLCFTGFTQSDFEAKKIRLVPPAHVRSGCYIGPNTVLMPSYINTGAFIDENSMIDIWATIGSCAQIGKNVHVSANTVIGGVLEPLQANPVIIEDNCFIGSNSSITEGVIVQKNAVISMGVHLNQSTKIYNRHTQQIHYGIIPENSVVIAGTLPADDNSHSIAAAIIVKQVDAKTRQKIGINEILREN